VSQFVSEIDAFVQKDVTAPTFIVAHSHGGNVAVQALRAAPQIEQHVAGLITVATPFLVAHKRRGGWPYFFALIGGIVLAASSYFALVPAKLNISSSQSLWLAGVLVVLSMWMSFWQSKRVLRALLPDRQENPINRKLLVIRTSGDEAGASLGAAYMVAYSARVCARMVTAVVAYPARWLQDLLYWKADSQMSVRKELLLVFGGAVSCWIAASWHPQLEFAALAFWGCVGVAAALIVPIAVMWLLRLVWALVRICANGIFETAIAGMLIPFGPETFIAAPFVLVSAEAVPTTGEDLRDPVPVLQLPLKESALQHSFDRHQHELARIIVQFVGARSHLSKTPARAA
jgi:hypothetical protein